MYNGSLKISYSTVIGFNVQERPVTQQGVGGMKIATPSSKDLEVLTWTINFLIWATASYGRVVRDKTFFMAELRQKAGLLNTEMGRLNAEHEKVAK